MSAKFGDTSAQLAKTCFPSSAFGLHEHCLLAKFGEICLTLTHSYTLKRTFMQFSDVIGQSEAKKQIQRMLNEQRVPHALLFAGPEGCGKLPMALALAQRLLCQTPAPSGDSCGECKNCRMAANRATPTYISASPSSNAPERGLRRL